MTRTPPRQDRSTPLEYLVSVVAHPGRRLSVLLAVAYLTGVGGLLLSVVGNPGNPRSVYGVAGIGLMGLCFLCLFVLSITVLNLTDGAGDG